MTPQCTDCLGYHGQAKPCPAFGTTKAATGVTLAQWQDVCHRHNTLFLENKSLRAENATLRRVMTEISWRHECPDEEGFFEDCAACHADRVLATLSPAPSTPTKEEKQ